MRKIVKSKQRFARREYASLDDAREELADEPFKLELVDLKGTTADDDSEIMEVGAGDLTAYDNVHAHTGERVWGDLCRGPHLPTTGYIPAFKVLRSVGGLLARRPAQRPAAAHLRHGVGVAGGPGRLPGAARRGRAPRPPPPGHRARPVQLPRRDRLRAGGVPPQGRDHPQGARGLQPPAPRRGRLRVRQHPARHQGRAVRDLGPPRLVPRGHVPGDAARRRVRRTTAR